MKNKNHIKIAEYLNLKDSIVNLTFLINKFVLKVI